MNRYVRAYGIEMRRCMRVIWRSSWPRRLALMPFTPLAAICWSFTCFKHINATPCGRSPHRGWLKMAIQMFNKFKCFLGLHRYANRYYANKRGIAVGTCCCKCGLWIEKRSQRCSWEEWESNGQENSRDRVMGDLWFNAPDLDAAQRESVGSAPSDAVILYDDWKKSEHGEGVNKLISEGRTDEALWLAFRQGRDSHNAEMAGSSLRDSADGFVVTPKETP
jgi:hypothetical protein